MEVASSVERIINLHFSTEDSVPLEEIVDVFCLSGLSSTIQGIYGYVAEAICNIYDHASCGSNRAVQWSITVDLLGDLVAISITDNGQGIHRSVSARLSKPISQLEALSLAVNQGASDRNRGLGLKSIANGVAAGKLHAVLLESSGVAFKAGAGCQSFKRTALRVGTRVELMVADGDAV